MLRYLAMGAIIVLGMTFRTRGIFVRLELDELFWHYLMSREAEQEAFDSWMANQITDFEFQRYFIAT
jgi:hypothetical protein